MSDSDYRKRFRVTPGDRPKLEKIDPNARDGHTTKQEAQDEITHYAQRMRELQYLLHAENKRSLLIVLQGLDASGKDGTIRHVLGYMNPQGCHVRGFKQPTAIEAAHDFLWRAHKAAPATGEVTIFNRSHYEDVLVVRVHELVPKKKWLGRYEHINTFEALLAEHGTHVIKFFLHISPEEQLARFKKRLDDPTRWWKISEADYNERLYWKEYQHAYEDVFERCNSGDAPWYIIPANHKWFRNLAISRIVTETMESLQMSFPEPSVNIDDIRRKYHEIVEKKL